MTASNVIPTRLWRRWIGLCLLAGAIVLLAPAARAVSAPAGPEPADWAPYGWAVVPGANPATTNGLFAVAAAAANDIWAVGFRADPRQPQRPLAEHWDGNAWAAVSTAGLSDGFLTSVAVAGPNDVWAVGNVGFRTRTAHWDGQTWSTIPSPNQGTVSSLVAVAAAGAHDVWAVGTYSGPHGPYQTLIEHWNGAAWSVVPSPNIGSGENSLFGVTVVGPLDVWAVGYHVNATLIEHWDGQAWSIVPSPNPGCPCQLRGVAAVGPADVWAVGVSNGSAPLTEHWNGAAWSVVPSPRWGGLVVNVLMAVTALAANDVWAVGHHTPRTLVMHWDGAQWNIAPSPNVGENDTENSLFGVVGLAHRDVWAVGASDAPGPPSSTLVEHYHLLTLKP